MSDSWSRDYRLIAHMAVTAVLIGLLTVLFACVLALLVRIAILALSVQSLARLPDIVLSVESGGRPWWYAWGIPVVAAGSVFAGLTWLHRWRRGLLRKRIGAGTRDPPSELQRQLTMLATTADVPVPDLRVIESSALTAFTTGLRPASAQITVTTALVATLSPEQRRAVLAHELSHIKNGDAAVMNAVMLPVVVASGLWTAATTGPKDKSTASHPRAVYRGVQFEGVVSAVYGVFAGLFWILASFATAAFARYRELAADRGAAALTGSPTAMATALETVDGRSVPDTDPRIGGANPLAIVPVADSTDAWTSGWQTPLEILPETLREWIVRRTAFHPATATRIDRLQELTADYSD
ncbi:M48 family metallopeptidase [Halapricum desulfuricans]|uniref:Zn-dependent protease with chaperone function n=1 Tax=Halapricum desulfuricans TaxID=2841257 RepID=A0A897NTA4_9EURY|nr:M48 family metalloprotease [Halapricum desulfuricans]QSG16092.1 Zn-dependent protease with chaperone function [Halapricum desulfuricans]